MGLLREECLLICGAAGTEQSPSPEQRIKQKEEKDAANKIKHFWPFKGFKVTLCHLPLLSWLPLDAGLVG